jgi:hypothetical protein
MNNDEQEFLNQCAEQAMETLKNDRENEDTILEFWNYQRIVETIGEAVSRATYYSDGSNQVDMQKYAEFITQSGILNERRNNFDQEQIDTIAQSSLPAYLFAIYICKGRFPEGEEAIQRDLKLWNEYQTIVDKFEKFGYR